MIAWSMEQKWLLHVHGCGDDLVMDLTESVY